MSQTFTRKDAPPAPSAPPKGVGGVNPIALYHHLVDEAARLEAQALSLRCQIAAGEQLGGMDDEVRPLKRKVLMLEGGLRQLDGAVEHLRLEIGRHQQAQKRADGLDAVGAGVVQAATMSRWRNLRAWAKSPQQRGAVDAVANSAARPFDRYLALAGLSPHVPSMPPEAVQDLRATYAELTALLPALTDVVDALRKIDAQQLVPHVEEAQQQRDVDGVAYRAALDLVLVGLRSRAWQGGEIQGIAEATLRECERLKLDADLVGVLKLK